MTILGHTLPEVQKFLIALLGLIIAGVALFVGLDPGFQAGVETLIIAVIGVVAVFALPNPTGDAVYKALAALATSLLAVLEFYATIPSSTTTKVLALLYAFAVTYAVWRKTNAPTKPPVNSGQKTLI
jgi:hypothetical protein